MSNESPLPVKNPFEYHKPSNEQTTRIGILRYGCNRLAGDIHENCLPSRERDLAITKLGEVSMWANKSVIMEPEP